MHLLKQPVDHSDKRQKYNNLDFRLYVVLQILVKNSYAGIIECKNFRKANCLIATISSKSIFRDLGMNMKIIQAEICTFLKFYSSRRIPPHPEIFIKFWVLLILFHLHQCRLCCQAISFRFCIKNITKAIK